MLIRHATDQPLALQRIEAIDDGFVGGNAAPFLHFADEGGAALLADVAGDEIERGLLLGGELDQIGLRVKYPSEKRGILL